MSHHNRYSRINNLLKARTVGSEKQPLLANGSETTVVCRQGPRNKQTEQRPLIGNTFLMNKYLLPLLGDAFAVRHIPMEMLGATLEEVFYVVHGEGL
jgi:hypothetical protein